MSTDSKFSQCGFATRAVHAGNDTGGDCVVLASGVAALVAYIFSVDIEDADDIIADLRQAMEQVELL